MDWCDTGAGDRPTLRLRDNLGSRAEHGFTGAFARYSLLAGDATHDLRLTDQDPSADSQLAMAIYQLVDAPPPGVTNGTVTFRDRVLDRRLLGAAIGDPGQRLVSFELTVPRGPVSFHTGCYGDGRAVMDVRVEGESVAGLGCAKQSFYDGYLGSESSGRGLLADAPPGSTVTVTLQARDADDEPLTDASGLVLALGVYSQPERTVEVGGWTLPTSQEWQGHEFVEESTVRGRPGQSEVTTRLSASDRTRIVTTAVTGKSQGRTRSFLTVDGRRGDSRNVSAGDPTSTGCCLVVQPGETPRLTFVVRGQLDSVVAGLLISRSVD